MGILEKAREGAGKLRKGIADWQAAQKQAKEEREARIAAEQAEMREQLAREAALEADRKAAAAIAGMNEVIALFQDGTNQVSVSVQAFYEMFKSPYRLKAPYIDRYAGAHSGMQAHNATAAVGSILGSAATAHRRVTLEGGMDNFEIARYVYDLAPREVAMLKIAYFLFYAESITAAAFHAAICSVLYNGGDCILRAATNPRTEQPFEVTNVQEQACRACLHDNMPVPKVAFDAVFQIAVRDWKILSEDPKDFPQADILLGAPLQEIMG